jgi:hypothetical protein
MNIQPQFDKFFLYNKYNNSNYLNNSHYNENKKLCEWLNENYTFCSDDFQEVINLSYFNTKYNCCCYKILLKNPNPYIKIKYISFFSLDDYKGSKINIQYQNDDFLNHETIIKLFEFFTNKIIYQGIFVFDKDNFNELIENGYYYYFDSTYHIGISINFHIFEYNINTTHIADIQWTSDDRKGKVTKITKNLSENRDEWSCYN